MKNSILAVVMLAIAFTNTPALAKGDYSVSVTQLSEQEYSVILLSSYSDYYDVAVEGIFSSRGSAEKAGREALVLYVKSGVNDEPEHCWYDIDWL